MPSSIVDRADRPRSSRSWSAIARRATWPGSRVCAGSRSGRPASTTWRPTRHGANGLLVTNARGVFAIPIGEYVSGVILRVNQPIARLGRGPGRPSLAGSDESRTASMVRGADGGASSGTGRSGARWLGSWPRSACAIIAVKPRPDSRADPSYRVPGTGDPDGSIPERIVGVEALLEVAARRTTWS